ncbi:MAG: BREX-1 system adenine-specific DNA-methyltransferase PglX, partial [Muribaculum sp.]|nr:BREX-1 system adenine-specific DNA-methyltransferase PglX [Muribaculum sp.]
METGKLKRFATDARAKLRAGVASKIKSLGFDAKGQLMPGVKPPVLMVGGCIWNEQILPSSFASQWEALRSRIERKGLREVVEEAAYTWFNRLMAIRILTMNNITEPVLRFVDEARTPKIVDDARQGRIMDMPVEQRERLETLFKDATRINEQFALLVAEFCHHTPVLQACFGAMDDYTEILLPSNILDKNGFVDMLNSADFISADDYKSPELIGWLYQFYISDRKDEVFAKKGKVEADEIPAATQIFTPNWIVKYMVQNAVLPHVRFNRLPDEDKKYLVSDELPEDPKKPKDLKVADLACGSGHILNECFDILYDLYIASGYDRRDAIENIFAENLLGIDIDERARQLSTFALMLKACQKDETFADAHSLPQVLGMPDCSEAQAEQFFKDSDITGEAMKELREAFKLMKDSDSLGSIMKFDISGSTRVVLQQTLKYWESMTSQPESVIAALPAVRLILALTDYYDAIVMNPPYMPTSRVDVLKAYAQKNYPDSKADLFSVFMDVCIDRLKDG